MLLCVTSGHDIHVKDATTGEVLCVFTGHTNTVLSVAFSPDGWYLVSGSRDKTVRIWNVTTGEPLQTLEGHAMTAIRSVAYSPDGQQIVSGSWDNAVRVWDAVSGQILKTLNGHTRVVCSVVYSPDNQHIASGSKDGTIRIWDVANGLPLHVLTAQPGLIHIRSVAYSPDGRYLASGGGGPAAYDADGRRTDCTVYLWDATNGLPLHVLTHHTQPVAFVTFSPDSRHIASVGYDAKVCISDATLGYKAPATIIDVQMHDITALAYPDNQHIICGYDLVTHSKMCVLDTETRTSYDMRVDGEIMSIFDDAWLPPK